MSVFVVSGILLMFHKCRLNRVLNLNP